MTLSVGTFNLNNLFSRWNVAATAPEAAPGAVTVRYEFTDPVHYRMRTFAGNLVHPKSPQQVQRIADRMVRISVDVLAVQEVEDIAVLRELDRDHLGGMYPHAVLIEGNDARFIDVGVLSKYPLGAVTTHQTAVHPADPSRRVFSRDLLEVEVLSADRRRRLFTLYTTHLKSRFVPFMLDPAVETPRADALRRRQAETIARIVAERQRPDARYVLLGDMNDAPGAPTLEPLTVIEGRTIVDGLERPVETRPAPPDAAGPPVSPRWTHRYKPSGEPAHYELLDHIYLSPALAARQTGAWIDRRTRLGGDGSDHDPAWVVLDL